MSVSFAAMREEEIYRRGVYCFNAGFKKHYHAAIAEWEKIPKYQYARTALAMCAILGVGRPREGRGFPPRTQEWLMNLIGIKDDIPALMRELINAYSGVLPYDWNLAKCGMESSVKRGGDTVVPCIAAYCTLEKPYPEFADMMREDQAIDLLDEMAQEGYPLATQILLDWLKKQDKETRAKADVKRIQENERQRIALATAEKCFLENAFLFYAGTKRILDDDALAFIQVPFNNNLAYTGTSGLRGATLGTYVYWWQIYEDALILGEKSEISGKNSAPRLLYHIAGSSLSGCNRCGAVDLDGVTSKYVVPFPFFNAWKSFMEANRNYTTKEESERQSTLTLQDAVRILRNDPATLSHYDNLKKRFCNA